MPDQVLPFATTLAGILTPDLGEETEGYRNLSEKILDRELRPIAQALEDLMSEVKMVMDGEACEHDVGICYCETFRRMEAGQKALEALKGK